MAEYTKTEIAHIWFNLKTGKYHWEDEANIFDETPYDTIEEANKALSLYCVHILGI